MATTIHNYMYFIHVKISDKHYKISCKENLIVFYQILH